MRSVAIDHPLYSEFVGQHSECFGPERLIERHRDRTAFRKISEILLRRIDIVQSDRERDVSARRNLG